MLSSLKHDHERITTLDKGAIDTITAPSTRVVQDVWHALKRISVPKSHGIRRMFQRKLTDAVLLMDQTDVKRVKDVLAKKGETLDMGMY